MLNIMVEKNLFLAFSCDTQWVFQLVPARYCGGEKGKRHTRHFGK